MPIVRILPAEEGQSRSKIVMVDVVRRGKTERLVISTPRDVTVNLGDSIRCLSGFAVERGHITAVDDIGSVMRGTSATTR